MSIVSVSSKLSQAKIFGGIGSILMLLILAPHVGVVLFIVGVALVLVALKYISEEINEPAVFRNALYGFILLILAPVIVTIVGLIILGTVLSISSIISGSSIVSPGGITISTEVIPGGATATIISHHGSPFSVFLAMAGVILVVVLIAWIILIVSSIFIRRSLSITGDRLRIGLFGVAGLLYLIGSVLSIILVGLVIIGVAIILQIIAFFSIPERIETSQQTIKA